MRILLSAYACEPNKGSEPGVGWNWAKHLAEYHQVIIVTRRNNKESIEEELKKNPIPNIRTIYYDPPQWVLRLKRGAKGVQLFYYIWQYGAYQYIKKTLQSSEYDYVFSITFGNVWKPTFMYKLKKPFIWGPIGGGEAVPKTLLNKMTLKQRIMEYFRRFNKYLPISNPWLNSICRHSDMILVRTYDTLACIRPRYKEKCRIMIETGISQTEYDFYRASYKKPSDSKEIIYVGRLISLKMVDISIRAFSKVVSDFPEAVLRIVGDGEMRKSLEQLVKDLNLTDNVHFMGSVSRTVALQMLSDSRMLVMPSCKEGGAWVLFEGLMCGKPIICMNTAGMKVVVTPEAGALINPANYEDMVEQFADKMLQFMKDDQLADQVGENALKLAREQYLWKNKISIFQKYLSEIESKGIVK